MILPATYQGTYQGTYQERTTSAQPRTKTRVGPSGEKGDLIIRGIGAIMNEVAGCGTETSSSSFLVLLFVVVVMVMTVRGKKRRLDNIHEAGLRLVDRGPTTHHPSPIKNKQRRPTNDYARMEKGIWETKCSE